jgi:hypothetical protein
MKYFQNGGTSGNTGNRRHLYFFKWKALILTSDFDSTLNFEFRASFFQHLSVIVFDLCHLFCKKVRLQGFIKKCIIPEPSEINNKKCKNDNQSDEFWGKVSCSHKEYRMPFGYLSAVIRLSC